MGDNTPRGTLGTVHNAALLLTLLSEGPAHQALTDLAERSGMSLPTLHRLLRSLALAGLVEQDPESSRYGLGPELVRLAEQYLGRLPVLKVAGPYLVDLRTATGATVTVTTLAGTDAVVADRLDGEDVGGVYRDATRVRPALDSAAGRVLLAHADDAAWDAACEASRDGGPSEPDRRGWREAATLAYVPPGAGGRPELAAPVRDDRTVVAALSLAIPGPADDTLLERYGPPLLRATSSISRVLGHG